ncbi:MAG TPA: hypothetical protein VJL10_11485 [Anaerolineales bacterium]|nr:hypothetical protein [Anaerolineales bacterium]
MTKKATTPEFELLASAANFIRPEFEKDKSPWAGSQFEWVLSLPSASKGKLGKRLVNQWCAIKGLSIDSSPDSQADMMINGHRVEIKFSTLWEASIYKFQQLRDQNYEYAVCLGISPFEAHCWVISKKILKQFVIGHMGQHTGSGGQETAWFAVNPHSPPSWILPFGGTLEQAYRVLKSLSSKK